MKSNKYLIIAFLYFCVTFVCCGKAGKRVAKSRIEGKNITPEKGISVDSSSSGGAI